MLGAVGGEEDMQIVARRFCVTKLELNGLTFLHRITDGDPSALLVRSDQIAHEKITAVETALVLIDGNTDVQSPVRIPALGTFEGFKYGLQPRERRLPAKLIHHVLFGPGDHITFADRAAALGDDRPDGNRARELDPNQTAVEDFSVFDYTIFSWAMTPASQSADGFRVRITLGHD